MSLDFEGFIKGSINHFKCTNFRKFFSRA